MVMRRQWLGTQELIAKWKMAVEGSSYYAGESHHHRTRDSVFEVWFEQVAAGLV